jgi:LDH2 family malate/lactate/ureidoglycolate dehydrogenase
MTDRLSLTDALTDANIDRQNAECIATVIFRAIRNSAGAAPDLDQREPRIARAFESAGIAEEQARRIAAVIIELIRLRHPAHAYRLTLACYRESRD